MADPRAVRRLGLAIAAALFVVDQAVKWAIVHWVHLPERYAIDLLPVFRLIWVENPGISMGFLRAGSATERWLLVALTGGIAVAVLFWLWRERSRLDGAALGLVLGGALGNICDRVRLGYVADFLDIHIGAHSLFMVFNVADAAITIGVLLLVVRAVLVRKPANETVTENGNA